MNRLNYSIMPHIYKDSQLAEQTCKNSY